MSGRSALVDYETSIRTHVDPATKARLRKRVAGLGAVGVAVVLAVGAWYGRFVSISVCDACGAEESTTEWQIPLTGVTYWRSTHIRQTPLSTAISRNGLAPGHTHTWQYVHGSGNGIMCAVGSGGRVFTSLRYPAVATFIDGVARYQGVARARKWTAALLDVNRSNDTLSMILFEDVPEGGFTSREQFERWWQQHGKNLKTPP